MSKFRWLRIKLPEFVVTKDSKTVIISAIRSDGQPFAAWGPAALYTKEKLRKNLDLYLNDPALSFVANASPEKRKHYIDMYKGEEGWVEEPAP